MRLGLRHATKEELLEALEALTGESYISEACHQELVYLSKTVGLIHSMTRTYNPQLLRHDIVAQYVWMGEQDEVVTFLDNKRLQQTRSEAWINAQVIGAIREHLQKHIREKHR